MAMDAEALEVVLCGSPTIDVNDWRRHTVYGTGLSATSPRVLLFWKVVEKELDDDQRTRLLQFITGTSRLPAGGLLMFFVFLSTSCLCFKFLSLPHCHIPGASLLLVDTQTLLNISTRHPCDVTNRGFQGLTGGGWRHSVV
jgi:hypothetical protein